MLLTQEFYLYAGL